MSSAVADLVSQIGSPWWPERAVEAAVLLSGTTWRGAEEQDYTFRTHDHTWHPTDHEGIILIHRPAPNAATPRPTPHGARPPDWSKASKRRRLGKADG
jgi:hypothetical protein